MAITLAIGCLFSIIALCAYHFLFGRSAQIHQLRREVAELAVDVEHVQQLHHKRERRGNIETAREGKARKLTMDEEAAAILATAKGQQTLPLAAPAVDLREQARRDLAALMEPERRAH